MANESEPMADPSCERPMERKIRLKRSPKMGHMAHERNLILFSRELSRTRTGFKGAGNSPQGYGGE